LDIWYASGPGRVLVEKPEGKRPLGIHWHRREDESEHPT
jgi:hypothetical protein